MLIMAQSKEALVRLSSHSHRKLLRGAQRHGEPIVDSLLHCDNAEIESKKLGERMRLRAGLACGRSR